MLQPSFAQERNAILWTRLNPLYRENRKEILMKPIVMLAISATLTPMFAMHARGLSSSGNVPRLIDPRQFTSVKEKRTDGTDTSLGFTVDSDSMVRVEFSDSEISCGIRIQVEFYAVYLEPENVAGRWELKAPNYTTEANNAAGWDYKPRLHACNEGLPDTWLDLGTIDGAQRLEIVVRNLNNGIEAAWSSSIRDYGFATTNGVSASLLWFTSNCCTDIPSSEASYFFAADGGFRFVPRSPFGRFLTPGAGVSVALIRPDRLVNLGDIEMKDATREDDTDPAAMSPNGMLDEGVSIGVGAYVACCKDIVRVYFGRELSQDGRWYYGLGLDGIAIFRQLVPKRPTPPSSGGVS